MKTPFVNTKPIRLIELFGGIGSQAMALTNLGVTFEHYRLVEWDKYPVASYNAIHGTNFSPSDITKLHGEDLGIVDIDKYTYLLTYSFPCQDLSLAGKQRGMTKDGGTRSGLLWEVERLLNETDNLPQLMLMENVPQVHAKKNLVMCEKECDCKTCIFDRISSICGACYPDSFEQCLNGSVQHCPRYKKFTWWRLLYFAIMKRR